MRSSFLNGTANQALQATQGWSVSGGLRRWRLGATLRGSAALRP